MPRYLLGVDVEKASIVGGLVGEDRASDRKVVRTVREPARASEGIETSLPQILAVIEHLIGQAGVAKQQIAGIGIRVPGEVDSQTGVVVNLPDFPGWREVSLARQISERFDLPVQVVGDEEPLRAGLLTEHQRVLLAAMSWPAEDQSLGLPAFVYKHAGIRQQGMDLIKSGPASLRLLARVGDEGRTLSLLATNFWRAWLGTDFATVLMASLGASRSVFSRSRTIVVSLDPTRFDLLVLDPALPQDFQPKSECANVDGAVESIIMGGAVRAFADEPILLLGTESPQLAAEVGSVEQPFTVLLAPEPAYERLGFGSASVPDPALSVDNLLGGPASTVGIQVEDITQRGRLGVTAALHGVEPATTVKVGTHSGTVVRTDSVTDSAFIEISPTASVSMKVATNGVMSGMTPRGHQRAEFIGSQSKTCPTTITGWDAQIPNPSSRRQACVYTARDAQPGDSGSALVTDDGWIVGFAFERTRPGESPAQCSWVWADSVLNRLKVKPV